MTDYPPGYYYVVETRDKDWEVWIWTGHKWYEPGEAEPKEVPYWYERVPQAPYPDDMTIS